MKKQKICWFSVLSLLVGVSSFFLFAVVLELSKKALLIYYAWIFTLVLSPFMPLLAKRIRTRNNQYGKTCEIITMIIAFFNISFFLSYVLMLRGAWVEWFSILFCVIIYKIVPPVEPDISQEITAPIERERRETEAVVINNPISDTMPQEKTDVQRKQDTLESPTLPNNHSAISMYDKQEYCRFCGAKLQEDSIYCHKCGKFLHT